MSRLGARQLLHDYMDGVVGRHPRGAGSAPAVGDKDGAIAVMRELTGALWSIAVEAMSRALE